MCGLGMKCATVVARVTALPLRMDSGFTCHLLNCSCRLGRSFRLPSVGRPAGCYRRHTMNTAFKIFLLVGALLYGLPGLVWWVNHRRAIRARQGGAAMGSSGPTT